MAANAPTVVRCPAGHDFSTTVRRRSARCRCGLIVYVRADGSSAGYPAAAPEPEAAEVVTEDRTEALGTLAPTAAVDEPPAALGDVEDGGACPAGDDQDHDDQDREDDGEAAPVEVVRPRRRPVVVEYYSDFPPVPAPRSPEPAGPPVLSAAPSDPAWPAGSAGERYGLDELGDQDHDQDHHQDHAEGEYAGWADEPSGPSWWERLQERRRERRERAAAGSGGRSGVTPYGHLY